MAAQTQPLSRPAARPLALAEAPVPAHRVALAAPRRLLVLVPAHPLDEAALARQVLSLASPRALRVAYLALAHDAVDESALRRRLANLGALTRTDQQPVDTLLSTNRHWLAAVRAVRQPGDELACLAGQTVFGWGRRRPQSVALAAALRIIVHELESAAPPVPAARRRPAVGALAGFIALLAIFFSFQVHALRLPPGAVQGAFLAALVIAEFVLIAAWDKFNR